MKSISRAFCCDLCEASGGVWENAPEDLRAKALVVVPQTQTVFAQKGFPHSITSSHFSTSAVIEVASVTSCPVLFLCA